MNQNSKKMILGLPMDMELLYELKKGGAD